MQANTKIATVYAQALLYLGKEEGQLEALDAQLTVCSKLLYGHHKAKEDLSNVATQQFFSAPIVPWTLKVEVIRKSLAEHIHPLLLNFLCVVAQRGRLNELALVQEIFHKEIQRALGRCVVEMSLAQEIDSQVEKSLKSALEEYLGKQVILEKNLDTDLIGGYRFSSGDLLVDNSVQKQLQKIRSTLHKKRILGEQYYEN